tara:strand:- start:70292 stop:71131 length:840 start_codon:yes stop_codon:yes gene_type:complete
MKAQKFIVYSNIWVSLGASAFTAFAYVAYNLEPNLYYLLFIFSSTLSVYTFHRIIRFYDQKPENNTLSERHLWIIAHKKSLLALFVLSTILSGYSLLHLPAYRLAKLLLPAVLPVLLYILPSNKFFKGLRHIPFLKVPVVGFIWMFLCGYIPLELEQIDYTWHFLVAQMLFIIAITLPFEIRDIKVDTTENVKSFATALGIKNTQKLALLLVIASYFLIWADTSITITALASWTLTVLICLPLILNSKEDKPELYFSGLVESALFYPIFFYLILRLILS